MSWPLRLQQQLQWQLLWLQQKLYLSRGGIRAPLGLRRVEDPGGAEGMVLAQAAEVGFRRTEVNRLWCKDRAVGVTVGLTGADGARAKLAVHAREMLSIQLPGLMMHAAGAKLYLAEWQAGQARGWLGLCGVHSAQRTV